MSERPEGGPDHDAPRPAGDDAAAGSSNWDGSATWSPQLTPPFEPEPAADPDARGPDARRRDRAAGVRTWALVLALAAVVGLAVPLGALVWARAGWEAENASLRDHVDVLTGDLNEANTRLSALVETEAQLEELKRQYSVQVDDGVSASEVEEELGEIIAAYQRCVDAQQDHFEVLKNADRYVASSIEDSERSIIEFCTGVHDAYLAYQDAHG